MHVPHRRVLEEQHCSPRNGEDTVQDGIFTVNHHRGNMANPTLSKQFGALPTNDTAGSAAADAALQNPKLPFTTGNDDPMTISGTVARAAFLLALVVGVMLVAYALISLAVWSPAKAHTPTLAPITSPLPPPKPECVPSCNPDSGSLVPPNG